MLRRVSTTLAVVLIGVCFLFQSAGAQSLEDFEEKVTHLDPTYPLS
jgi:hypothetical protein